MRVMSMNKTLEDFHHKVEEQILIKAARDDPQAFGKLYQRYIHQVVRYLYSRLGNIRDAEDVAAQTFISAFEAFGSFKRDKYFSSWLFTIARNKSVDHYRKSRPTEQLEESTLPASHEAPEKLLERSDELNDIARLIRKLPDEDQELMRLRFVAELSFQEMAALLHRRNEAVKKAVYRILAKIKAQMEVGNE
jgi:RNA polymerase sigma-70 factor (ECF subfamily)